MIKRGRWGRKHPQLSAQTAPSHSGTPPIQQSSAKEENLPER